MKHLKNSLSVILAAVMVFASVSLFAAAGSAGPLKVSSYDGENGLEITVTPSKQSYAYGDTAQINVKVKNNFGFDIDKLMIGVYSKDCKLPAGSRCKSDVMRLDKDGTASFSVGAKLGSSAKLNFFQRIIMFFRGLFSRDTSFEKFSESEKSSVSLSSERVVHKGEASQSVVFGPSECVFEVTVLYDCGFTDAMSDTVQEVNGQINRDLYSDEFRAALVQDSEAGADSEENRKEVLGEKLTELADEGLINSNFEYADDDGAYWFEYNLGAGRQIIGGVSVRSHDSAKNSSAPSGFVSPQAAPDGSPDGLLQLFGFTKSRELVYSEKLDYYDRYYGAGMASAEYEQCRNLDGRTFLCFSCHGGVTSPFFGSMPYIVMPEYPVGNDMFEADTNEKNAGFFIDYVVEKIEEGLADLAAETCGVLFPAFFRSKTIDNSVVFLESCCAFGEGSYDDRLAQGFIDAGAKAVIGFQQEVFSSYSSNFMMMFMDGFFRGATAQAAFDACKAALGETDGDTAVARIKGDGSVTLPDCGPDAGNLAGLIIHYTETTAGNNREGDLPVLLVSKAALGAGTPEEIAEAARNAIIGKYRLWNGAVVTSVRDDGGFYLINAQVAD